MPWSRPSRGNISQSANNEALVKRIQDAFDRVAWEKDFVLCEGSGHAGVGSVFDLSNAQVAKILGCKVIIVTQGGIGKPIDEVCLNRALFEKEGVEIIGVIINKVLEEKIPEITQFVRRGLRRKDLELLGVLPHEQILCNPTVDLIREELRAELLNPPPTCTRWWTTWWSARWARKTRCNFSSPACCSSPPATARTSCWPPAPPLTRRAATKMAGIVLTGGLRPAENMLKVIHTMPIPVLLAQADSYQVASKVHNLTVKTQPNDAEKISLIRDIVARHVNVKKIIDSL